MLLDLAHDRPGDRDGTAGPPGLGLLAKCHMTTHLNRRTGHPDPRPEHVDRLSLNPADNVPLPSERMKPPRFLSQSAAGLTRYGSGI